MSGEALPGFKPVTFSRSVASPHLLSFPERENNFNLWWGFSTLTDATSMKTQNKTWCKIFSISNIFSSSAHYLRSSLKNVAFSKQSVLPFLNAPYVRFAYVYVYACVFSKHCLAAFRTRNPYFKVICSQTITTPFWENTFFFVEWPMISQVLETVH